jgi:peptidyl-tRNA hydrolase
MLKVGDIIFCKKSCIMNHNNESVTTLNKSYEIVEIDDGTIFITDDIDYYHGFDLNKNSISYYGIWFCTNKDLRCKKLKKLQNESW